MNKERAIAYLALLLSAVALNQSYQATTNSGTKNENCASKEEASLLSARIGDIKQSYEQLSKSVLSLSFDYYASQNKSAVFSPTDTGFQLLNTAYGNLLVSLKNIEKHGNGYSLIFDIGNPTSISIAGLKGRVKWGPKTDWTKYYSEPAYAEDINKKTQSKDFEVLTDIYPGSWNQETIMVGPATEEQIGGITLSNIQSSSVKMRQVHLPH